MQQDSDQPPGRGFLGWLGRQIGHVRKAAKTDVGAKKVYHHEIVVEQRHPHDANIVLRRTTTDEVIVNKPPQES